MMPATVQIPPDSEKCLLESRFFICQRLTLIREAFDYCLARIPTHPPKSWIEFKLRTVRTGDALACYDELRVLVGLLKDLDHESTHGSKDTIDPRANQITTLVSRLREMDDLIRSIPWQPAPEEEEWKRFLSKKRIQKKATFTSLKVQHLKKQEALLIRRYYEIVPKSHDGLIDNQSSTRESRKAAWLNHSALWQTRRSDLNQVFDALVHTRHLLAQSLGFDSYTHYLSSSHEICFAKNFSNLITQHFRPLQQKLHAFRKELLGIPKLRPFDMNTHRHCNISLEFWTKKMKAVMENVYIGFAHSFTDMVKNRLIDTNSNCRSNNGLCLQLWYSGKPYLRLSLKPTFESLMSGIHEIGHGIHILASSNCTLPFHRKINPMAGELAALTFELLTLPHLNIFHTNPQNHARAQRKHLEKTLSVFATADAISRFEKEIYLNKPCPKERSQIFFELIKPSLCDVDYTGYETILENWYHRIPTLVSSPGYFINYVPAQAGALLIRHNIGKDQTNLDNFLHFLQLGSSLSPLELYEHAGVNLKNIYDTELLNNIEKEILDLYEASPPS